MQGDEALRQVPDGNRGGGVGDVVGFAHGSPVQDEQDGLRRVVHVAVVPHGFPGGAQDDVPLLQDAAREFAQHPVVAVVGAQTVGGGEADDFRGDAVLLGVCCAQGFAHPLAFGIAGADGGGVDVAAVGLADGRQGKVGLAVHFERGHVNEAPDLVLAGQFEEVRRALQGRLDGADGEIHVLAAAAGHARAVDDVVDGDGRGNRLADVGLEPMDGGIVQDIREDPVSFGVIAVVGDDGDAGVRPAVFLQQTPDDAGADHARRAGDQDR